MISTAEEPVVLGDLSFNLLRPQNSDALISEAEYLIDERLPY